LSPAIAGAMKISGKPLKVLLLASALAAFGLAHLYKVIAGGKLDVVRQDLQRVFGSDLDFDGLEVSLLPRPGFSASGIRLADDPRFAATPVVRTKELVLGVDLWKLLQGRIIIDSLIFKTPELQVITDEEGALNLTALIGRRKALRSFPRMDSASSEGKPGSGVGFAIRKVRVVGGKVEFLDRSTQPPAELHIRNIDLTLRGFHPAETMGIRLAAALSDSLRQDMKIEGQFGPQIADRSWSQRPMDLIVRFDSLYMPVIVRAISALRDRVPRALNVTGPMAILARASGTVERPRIDDFSLKIPLFGSSDYNAFVTGAIAFSDRRSWATAELDGKASVVSVDLDRLRGLPLVEQLISPAVETKGPASVYGRFAGTWDTLRVGALLIANKAEIRYGNWLHKPAGVPAEIKTRISRRKHRVLFHESELVAGALRTNFSGSLETDPIWRLALRLNGKQDSLAAWNQIFSPSSVLATAGGAVWQITADRSLEADGVPWNIYGEIEVAGVDLRYKENGRRVDGVNGRLSLLGREARFEDVSFRVGSSEFSVTAAAADLLESRVQFQLRSPAFHSADLSGFGLTSLTPELQLKDLGGKGQMIWENGRSRLSGSFTAPEGSYRRMGFRDFRTEIRWSADAASVEDLSARIFKGTVHSQGRWTASDEKTRRLQLRWQADAIDVNLLVAELIPGLKDRLAGRLNGHGQIDAASSPAIREVLDGAGETAVERGVIKDFNLVRQLLLRGSGASATEETTARWPRGFADLAQGRDTPFESLKANFTFGRQRLRTDNLVIATLDYTVTGAGWIGLDGSTRWNGLLVLSPRLTQEIQQDYRVLRYLLDRRGRLAISFRVEGTIPNVKIRLENRLFAQLLRSGTAARDEDGAGEEPGESDKPAKHWLPDSVERFLNR
jgi:uncharacterized protein involved in outer membrane biogenesis